MTDEEAAEIRRVLFDLITAYEGVARREQDSFALLCALREALQQSGHVNGTVLDARHAELREIGQAEAAAILSRLESLRVLLRHRGPVH